jgi:nickel-type superoxide dismutase maturation protease
MLRRGLVWPLFALLAVIAVRQWLDVVEVRGRSMAPALVPGDRLIVVRLVRRPRAGEVVVAPDPRNPSRELIKRVAAADGAGVLLRGDDPAFSTDARTFGPIPPGTVRWRVVWRYWPLDRAGPIRASAALALLEEGGEAACTFPEALVAGD